MNSQDDKAGNVTGNNIDKIGVSVPDVSFRSGTIRFNGEPSVHVEYPMIMSPEAVNTLLVLGLVQVRYSRLQRSLEEIKDLVLAKSPRSQDIGQLEGSTTNLTTKPTNLATNLTTSPVISTTNSDASVESTKSLSNSNEICCKICCICGAETVMKFNSMKFCRVCFDIHCGVSKLLQNVPKCSECSKYLPDQTVSSLGFNLCANCDNKEYL